MRSLLDRPPASCSRVLAIGLDSTLARYAREVGNTKLERETVAALERTLIDWD